MKNDQASVTRLLQTWDRGSKSTRVKMLQDFVCENTYKTGPELELEFAHAASLFLTRLTAWLRLTYMMGTHVKIQLQAIGIFVGASSGHKFLAEFLEVGGVLTVLEILGLNQAKEEDKAEALKILMHVVNAGRRYKELVCESFGIRAVAECLAKSNSEETQDLARNLLHQLSNGNPKYENQVYKALIALLKSSSPKAQQMAAQTLRIIQPVIGTASPTIVDPVLMLLRSLHLEVQYEACELIKDLMQYNIRNAILKGLVSLLKPTKDDVQESAESVIADPDSPQLQPPLPIYVQQAAAAKMICILAKESPEIAESLVQLRAVHGILLAMGNTLYAESQRQAGIALEFFVRSFPLVNDRVKEALGDKSYEEFMTQPDNMFVNMTAIQADVLVSNKVNIPGVMETQD
ncbi:armadillo-like helical domain containing protein 1 isoform X2 [Actinia tenebrosa]|uniref:Armadillo-like helical domain containing protein 1 isoform X2 n=1 Tax=Actinia tenebrosa TaxID=6105 RepID=A0A6P8GYL2_ACTTE|nr:armadillo-like helical domain containing protein 1 isoform X2 [Actinia tenebrosa]